MSVHITYYVAQSVDGFIAREDGAVDWLPPFQEGGPDYGFHAFLAGIDVLIMGRGTYEHVLGYGAWPYTHPTVVCAHGRLDVRHGVLQWQHDIPSLLTWLAERGYSRAWLVGGGQLAASFAEVDALHTMITTVVPVALGAGIPLFSGMASDLRLSLTDHDVFPNGLVQLQYVRV